MTLDEYLESRREAVFSWGTNDCARFCADWAALRGVDMPLRWNSEEEGMALIAKFGSLEAAVSSFLGEPKAPNLAVKGEIMQGKDDSLGICVGAKVAAPTREGMKLIGRDHYVRAWSWQTR